MAIELLQFGLIALMTLLVVVDPFGVAPVATNRGRATTTARRCMNSSGVARWRRSHARATVLFIRYRKR
jgi:hypothetical protein